jgi:hypothetical protein
MSEVAVAIGGARLAVRSLDPFLRLALSSTQAMFLSPAGDTAIDVTIGRGDPDPAALRGEPLFQSGGLWKLYAAGDEVVFSLETAAFGPRPYRTARFDRHFRRGHIDLHDADPASHSPTGRVEPLEYPLDELVLMNWLSQGRGIELHACGIVDDDGQGLIFCGQSGAGKTTAARLWNADRVPPATVLSDDRIIVRPEHGRFYMYGTPWHGEASLAAALRVPLKGIFLLEKSSDTALRALPVSEAVSRLFACAFVPFHDPDAVGFAVELIAQLTRQVLVQAIQFQRDRRFVALVKRAAG